MSNLLLVDIAQQPCEEARQHNLQESSTSNDTNEPLMIQHIDNADTITQRLSCFDEDDLISFIGDLLSKHAEKKQLHIPLDYISCSLSAMKRLQDAG